MLSKTLLALARKNKEANPSSWDELYANLVVTKIRDQNNRSHVDENEELCLLRKEVERLTKIIQTLHPEYEPSDEFAEYNEFVEQCKEEAQEELEI